ncbi:oxygen oxidoreductase [Verticillium alfalfae VaMs.102]|uniref:Oxygen oxidoreductase n=1 Tax=Verticillium alfalfae (strain VaMs.102 / ATCC MYA-4576 / FGSC 10136) TaxID=526221 RepID=C9SN80_VERA1|nr:oxygen oxidoreductase [Verticillium alfalfae VaMs.102]EEY20245.1 oxygen oxidoreductase [Verticillium alfalfae VaMs.102]
MPLLKSDPIVIVGAGAFGLSTALRLLEARFINITVLEKDDTLPSRFSAANDLNKIIRAEYEDPFYTKLTLEAIRAWQTPLFAPHFHQTGFLHCVSGSAPERAAATLARFHDSAKRDPWIEKHVVPIEGPEDIRQHTWQYNDGPLTGWRGYLNRLGGYAHSANALLGVYRFLRERGVKFYTGDRGAVTEIIYNEPSNPTTPRKSTGARTKTGDFPAKLVIVAAGAAAGPPRPRMRSARRRQIMVRRLLAQTLPALADRPLIKQSLCWFADTNDSDFIIDYVPNTDSTVLLMSGDSGHGFKMFPIVGNWVRDMLLATDGKQPISKFRWKAPVSTGGKDWGGAVSWRLGATKELKDLTNPKSSKL